MNTTQHLPSRLTETQFRRYEFFIEAALQQFPKPLGCAFVTVSLTTGAARLRDALLSLRTFKWKVSFDTKNLPALKVFETSEGVFLGGQSPKDSHVVESPKVQPLAGEWELTDIESLCSLISKRLLSGGVILPLVLDPSIISSLHSRFDINITTNPDAKTSLIL